MVTKLETLPAVYLENGVAAAPAIWRSIDMFEDFEAARADWDELYALAPASAYQSYAFAAAWAQTLGRAGGAAPLIIVARGPDGRALALLPLARARLGPLRMAMFMGGRESNFNLPLLRPGCGLDENAVRQLLREAARLAGVDFFYLRNMPLRFDGCDNPLAARDAVPSASFAYGTSLPADSAELKARISKDTRKKLRKKEAWLGELGELRYEHRAAGDRAREILCILTGQKAARLAAMGVASEFSDAAMIAFLARLADEGVLETHALSVSGRIVATYGGLVHRGRFSAMVNSFDPGERVARSSPGDLLLHALLADLSARGIAKFDLGAGEARYKNAVCEETIELCDAVIAASWKGELATPMLSLMLRGKRRIKQTPWMAKLLAKAQRSLAGKG